MGECLSDEVGGRCSFLIWPRSSVLVFVLGLDWLLSNLFGFGWSWICSLRVVIHSLAPNPLSPSVLVHSSLISILSHIKPSFLVMKKIRGLPIGKIAQEVRTWS